MDLAARVAARRRKAVEARSRSWPVGKVAVDPWESGIGHDDSRFSPAEYGDYIATSNDIYSIAMARARLMSGLELRFYKGRGSEKATIEAGRAVNLYRYVNPFWTAERLALMDDLCMSLWGESYWAIEPPGPGQPDGAIWWLKPTQMLPAPHEKEYLDGYWYQPITGGDPIHFTNKEIVWFRYPNPIDEFSALSPLAAARLAADTSTAMQQSNRQLFAQGMQIAGLITPPADKVTFSQEQANDLTRYLEKRFTGPANAHKWAVMRYEAQFKQMAITPKDAEFVAGLNLTFRQCCRAYGMQPALLGDLENATLANATAFERIEWSRTLKPDAQFRAAEVREQYLPRFRREFGSPDYCEFDFGSVPALQESESEAWAREAQALDRGAITINEWRAKHGMPPVPWGDEPWIAVNKAQIVDGEMKLPASDAKKLPDDEVAPANAPESPRALDHMAARRLLAAFATPVNGWSHR